MKLWLPELLAPAVRWLGVGFRGSLRGLAIVCVAGTDRLGALRAGFFLTVVAGAGVDADDAGGLLKLLGLCFAGPCVGSEAAAGVLTGVGFLAAAGGDTGLRTGVAGTMNDSGTVGLGLAAGAGAGTFLASGFTVEVFGSAN